jgi:hypothetical protein
MRLIKNKIINAARRGGYELTSKGRAAIVEVRADKHEAETGAKLAASLICAKDG